MMLREHHDDFHDTYAGPPPQVDLDAAGERLLAKGADAIERALSKDSAAFLKSIEQEGGQ